MLVYVDKLRSNEISLEKKLERERKRTQRYVLTNPVGVTLSNGNNE